MVEGGHAVWLARDGGLAGNERYIQLHITMFGKSVRRDCLFGRAKFNYSNKRDAYRCPAGEKLRRYWHEGRAAKEQQPFDGLYRYCLAKRRAIYAAGVTGTIHWKILRSVLKGVRDLARHITATDTYVTSR